MSSSLHSVPKAAFFRATSLAAVRDLQLTRVPLLDRLGFQASHHITAMLRPFTADFFGHAATYNMVTNAMYLGSCPNRYNDLRLFVVFPHLGEDIRKNSGLLACFWQRCILPAVEAMHSPTGPQGQQAEGMDYMSHDADDMEGLDESLAMFGLHTPVQRHNSMQASSLDQTWEGIEQTVASDVELRALSDMFLIVSWEPAGGSYQDQAFNQYIDMEYIDQKCGKVIYEEIRGERPVLSLERRTISRKRSATLPQLEERPDAKRTQSIDMM